MSKIVGIFAHPDDESIGPGGTLAKLAQESEVYLICATRGEKGGNQENLAQLRTEELEKAAQILGIKKVFHLNFPDGGLSNSLYGDIAKSIEAILTNIQPEKLITFEKQGLTGHIDHIVISMVTTFLFRKLDFVKTLWYNCLDKDQGIDTSDYFVYFPEGYKKGEIDHIEDITSTWERKVQAVQAHFSQRDDNERFINSNGREEYFLVIEKS